MLLTWITLLFAVILTVATPCILMLIFGYTISIYEKVREEFDDWLPPAWRKPDNNGPTNTL